MSVDSIVSFTVSGFAFGGASFGRLDSGKICFVRGGIPGEKIQVRITHEKKTFAEGVLLRIMEPSSDRIQPECPLFITPDNSGKACPGCSYQHIPYAMELEWKQKQFEGFLVRSGLADPSVVQPPSASSVRYGYRNKIRLTCEDGDGSVITGYRGEDNRTLIPIDTCPLARKAINDSLKRVRPELTKRGAVTFRWTLEDGVKCSASEDWNDGSYLTEQLGGYGLFRVSKKGFFQVNISSASELAERVVEAVKESGASFLAELYCGVGVFSILCAEAVKELQCSGIELDAEAIRYAQGNAKFRKVSKRCVFRCGDAEKMYSRILAGQDPEKSVLLLDPPRIGLSQKLVSAISESGPKTIIYISCGPDTLQRDLRQLVSSGYVITRTGMIDMFPATSHFESMTVLVRS